MYAAIPFCFANKKLPRGEKANSVLLESAVRGLEINVGEGGAEESGGGERVRAGACGLGGLVMDSQVKMFRWKDPATSGATAFQVPPFACVLWV